MSCDDVEQGLVAFHFGVLPEDTRAALESHLVSCAACLRSYLALKRDLDLSADSEEEPSERAEARLRGAVARKLQQIAPKPRRPKWEMPASFAFATAAIFAAMTVTGAIARSNGARPRGATASSEVGTPRPATSVH